MRNENFPKGFHLSALSSSLFLFLLLISVLLIFTYGCRSGASRTEGASEINVAAASNLTDAFNELGKEFTARTGIRVVNSFGATADLAKQIEQGAPFDVFAAADVEHVEALNSKALILSGTSAIYARGRLVLWIPPNSRASINRIEDIKQSGVERIAVAKPDVAPYGRATVEALKQLNIWQEVEPRVIYGQNVSQVKQYAATGNADVAFIPLALVKQGEGEIIEVEANLHQPIDQMIGIVRSTSKEEAARRFVAYVLSAEGQALLERYGYRKP